MNNEGNTGVEKCADCGIEMNENYAKQFTVCESCWTKHYKYTTTMENNEGNTEITSPVGIAVDLTLQNQKLIAALKEKQDHVDKLIMFINAQEAALKELIEMLESERSFYISDDECGLLENEYNIWKSAIERAKKLTSK